MSQFPTTINFAAMQIVNHEAIDYTEAANLRTQMRSRGAQRWEFKGTFPPMTRAEAAEIAAFEASIGLGGAFEIELPEYSDGRGTRTVSVVNYVPNYAIGVSQIAVNGTDGTLKKGDFFTFTNHTKVYMVTEDAAGSGTLDFFPSLREAVPDNTVLSHTGVLFTVRIPSNTASYSINNDSHVKHSIDLVEVV